MPALYTLRDERLGKSEKHFEGSLEDQIKEIMQGVTLTNVKITENVDIDWEA